MTGDVGDTVEVCQSCGDEWHRMDTLSASHFGKDVVCIGCVGAFLDTGEWPDAG